VKRYFDYFRSIIFPDLCLFCGDRLDEFLAVICQNCLLSLNYTTIAEIYQNKIIDRFQHIGNLNAAYALFYYRPDNPLHDLIAQIKYQGKKDLALTLGQSLGKKFKSIAPNFKADLILPIPIHPKRRAERGYNQSYEIALGLSEIIEIPTEDLLLRLRHTPSQTKLNKMERLANVKGVFGISKSDLPKLKNKHLIIVDDIITSGATLLECIALLNECGAKEISIISLCIAFEL
jgi:ComF family protein